MVRTRAVIAQAVTYISYRTLKYAILFIKYRTLTLIKTFQINWKSFHEVVISHQLYIGSPNHCNCGFELMC